MVLTFYKKKKTTYNSDYEPTEIIFEAASNQKKKYTKHILTPLLYYNLNISERNHPAQTNT